MAVVRSTGCRVALAGLALLALSACTRAPSPTESMLTRVREKPKDIKPVDAESAQIVAEKKGLVYHDRKCRYARALENPVGYKTAREASIKGLIPCEFCNPGHSSPPPPPEKTAAPAGASK